MKRVILSIVVVIALVVGIKAQAMWGATIYGWGSGWCPTCYTFEMVDIPNDAPGYQWTGYLAGWAFYCADGAIIDHVEVKYRAPGSPTIYNADINLTNGLYRPDVVTYYGANCPTPSNSGWHIAFNTPIPSGTWEITAIFWRGDVAVSQTGTVVVP